MLKSYEALYKNGQVKGLAEQPSAQSTRLIVTVLEEAPLPVAKRQTFPIGIAGQVEILGDMVNPIVDPGDWNV